MLRVSRVLLSLVAGCAVAFRPTTIAEGSTITICGQEVSLTNPVQQNTHDPAYLDLLDLEEIYTVNAVTTGAGELSSVLAALTTCADVSLPFGMPALLLVYTTDPDGPTDRITVGHCHALSVMMLVPYEYLVMHYYFERHSSVFNEIRSLRVPIGGEISLDLIRVLHFAAMENSGLPARSTLYIFTRNDLDPAMFGEEDLCLAKTLFMDHSRQLGLSTVGLYGDEIYEWFAPPPPQTPWCGNSNLCPLGDTPCIVMWPNGEYRCEEDDGKPPGPCLAISVSNVAQSMGIDLGVDFDFALMWRFRDNFLRQFEEGRDCIGFYYIFGMFAKMDADSLEQDAAALSYLYDAMNALMTDCGDPVIITPALRARMLTIINNHRDVSDVDFQNILDRMEADLSRFVGMTKSELLSHLTPVVTPIPIASEWGLIVMTLLLLIGAKIYFGRRRRRVA